MTVHTDIFKKSSKTYYYSSIFFPQRIQSKIARLYSFVRIADDYVDSIPQNKLGFLEFRANYEGLFNDQGYKPVFKYSNQSDLEIIQSFIDLSREEGFDPKWTVAFLDSMQMDTDDEFVYETMTQTKKYIYGSASVIGLFMAKILKLEKESYQGAELLGNAFQYINFIRDIAEDIDLGRCYFPQTELEKFELLNLTQKECEEKSENFRRFIEAQVYTYSKWQLKAEEYFKFIPKKYRIAIATASDMYAWTGLEIVRDPFVVFQKKVKPRKRRIFLTALKNLMR
jgi:15-cis-phytoene synthase